MKRILPYVVYSTALTIEIARVLLLAYSQKLFTSVLSVSDFMGLALLCLPAIFWFMLLQNEGDFHKLLNIIALIKFFCIVAAYLFWIKTSRLFQLSYMDELKALSFQYNFIKIFLPVDILIFFLSLMRERYLCR